MDYLITSTTVPEHHLAAARQRTTVKRVSAEIQQLLNAPWVFIRQNPDLWREGYNVAMYWDEDSVEVGVQVVREFEPTDLVICSATPAGTVATTAHFGPYSELGAAHR